MIKAISAEQRTLFVGERALTYTFARKRIKNINVTVRGDGSILVSAPARTSLKRVETFLIKESPFLFRAVEERKKRLAEKNPPLSLLEGERLPIYGISRTVCLHIGKPAVKLEGENLHLFVKNPASYEERAKAFFAFLKTEAATFLKERTEMLTPSFAAYVKAPTPLLFRTMKTKWGICRPQRGTVTLNRNLLFVPPHLADYVICHELTHFKHGNHSKAFWEELERHFPRAKEAKDALNRFEVPEFLPLKT